MENWERDWPEPARRINLRNIAGYRTKSPGAQESRILHQTDEQLEHYALGHLPEPKVAEVEEHLLVCAHCQDRLDELGAYATAMRTAITRAPAVEQKKPWLSWRPMIVVAGLAVFVLAIVLYLRSSPASAPIATLQLTAIRGEAPAVGTAKETDIALTDSPDQPGLRGEVVDGAGSKVWIGTPSHRQIKIIRPLSQGTYFVRLYDKSGALLHEYGFQVK